MSKISDARRVEKLRLTAPELQALRDFLEEGAVSALLNQKPIAGLKPYFNDADEAFALKTRKEFESLPTPTTTRAVALLNYVIRGRMKEFLAHRLMAYVEDRLEDVVWVHLSHEAPSVNSVFGIRVTFVECATARVAN